MGVRLFGEGNRHPPHPSPHLAVGPECGSAVRIRTSGGVRYLARACVIVAST
jgi:hypothetical protein